MKTPSGWMGWAALLLLAVAILYFLLQPKPVAVETGPVRRGLLRVTVDEEGRTRARDTFILSAPVSGQLARVTLRQGDPVKAGMVVARLRPVPLDERGYAQAVARVEAAQDAEQVAQARLGKAQAALDQSRRTLARIEDLAARGVESAERREEAQLAVTEAERETEAARFAMQTAQHELEGARAALLAARPTAASKGEADSSGVFALRAPVGGRVLRVHLQSEQVVAPGTPILEIGDAEALEIVVDVLSEDALRIRSGDLMLVDAGGGLGTMEARVRTVEPSAFTKVSALGVEEQRVHVVGDLTQAPGRLGDAYRVEARVVVWESDTALVAPASALFRRGERWAVFVVSGGRASVREAQIGQRNADLAELLDGLNEGERVVLYPGDELADGTRVRETKAAGRQSAP